MDADGDVLVSLERLHRALRDHAAFDSQDCGWVRETIGQLRMDSNGAGVLRDLADLLAQRQQLLDTFDGGAQLFRRFPTLLERFAAKQARLMKQLDRVQVDVEVVRSGSP